MSNYVVTVRYGLMAMTEKFISETDSFRTGDEVVVRTSRGIDIGEVMSRAREGDGVEETQGELLRLANDADRKILKHIRESKEPEEFSCCLECIRERDLPMRLVGVEHLFSGDKIIFYFLAENRVDFRELVKELARRYRTRIEMRQIGVRDEARLLADYEHCGRELCCRTFIRNLEPVTMRMAKMQKTTLDPSKISGHCGRLMCCLRFEDEVYSTLQAEIPARGSVCVTEEFTGEVIATDMFKQEVTLLLADGVQEVVHLDQVKEVQGRRGGGSKANATSAAFSPAGRADANRTSERFKTGGCSRQGGGCSHSRRCEEKKGGKRPQDAETPDPAQSTETDGAGVSGTETPPAE